MRPVVLVYKSQLLPSSETFIREQVLSYQNWRPILVGRHRVPGLQLEDLDVRLLGDSTIPACQSMAARFWPTDRLRSNGSFKDLEKIAPALLHAHFGFGGIEAAPIARAFKIPLVITLHGSDVNGRWDAGLRKSFGWLARSYLYRLLKLSEIPSVHFVAVSEAVRGRAIELGLPAEKVTVCYIGVDTERFRSCAGPPSTRSPHILFVGRLVEKKGCEYLIQAVAEVRKTLPSVTLIIVGDGPLRVPLEQLVRNLGVKAVFTGALPSSEVKREFEQARVFCLPSITARNGDAEGFGLVLLEAQSMEVPVVTSANGGTQEGILPGITGYSFPERDTRELTARLSSLMENDLLANTMGKEARRFVLQKYAIKDCTAQLERLYNSWIAAQSLEVAKQ